MCMQEIIARPWLPFSKYSRYRKGKGYKIMRVVDGKVQSSIYFHPDETCGYNMWYKARKMKVDCQTYFSGFHIYLDKPFYDRAEHHRIVEVEYKEGTVLGFDDNKLTIVANYMKVLI